MKLYFMKVLLSHIYIYLEKLVIKYESTWIKIFFKFVLGEIGTKFYIVLKGIF